MSALPPQDTAPRPLPATACGLGGRVPRCPSRPSSALGSPVGKGEEHRPGAPGQPPTRCQAQADVLGTQVTPPEGAGRRRCRLGGHRDLARWPGPGDTPCPCLSSGYRLVGPTWMSSGPARQPLTPDLCAHREALLAPAAGSSTPRTPSALHPSPSPTESPLSLQHTEPRPGARRALVATERGPWPVNWPRPLLSQRRAG